MKKVIYIFVLALSIYICTDASYCKSNKGKEFQMPEEMLFNFIDSELDKLWAKNKAEIGKLKTESDWNLRKRYVNNTILEMIGGFPERTPLNVRKVGEVDLGEYKIEKIIYESIPKFYVTANIYVPKNLKGPAPAIISPEGHSNNGKASEGYQTVFGNLAKLGFIVMTHDPIGQGERRQFWDFDKNEPVYATRCWYEHGYMGFQCFLSGTNLARYFIWDWMRGLDYLLARADVDPTRIGCTGNSGGGTLTTYVSALEPRITVSNPNCYITTLSARTKSRKAADDEQEFYPQALKGIDHFDILSLVHPRPLQIGAANFGFFPINGAVQTYADLKNLYYITGIPHKVNLVTSDTTHGWKQPLREGTYRWFSRWFLNNLEEIKEEPVKLLAEEKTYCTKSGQVIFDYPDAETIYSLNKKYSEKIIPGYNLPGSEQSFHVYKEKMLENIKQLAVYKNMQNPLNPVVVSREEYDEYFKEKIIFESEPGIYIPSYLFLPHIDNHYAASGRY